MAVGNGVFGGVIFYFDMAEPLRRGYAVAATDTGHEGAMSDASFAVEHSEKLVDFAWRAVHETALHSKAIVTALYSQPPRRSYWVGCSTGGRQGLKEAQRFPEDFDGISAGAPANNWVPLMAYAATVHKSQGSEYAAVVVPVHTQHFVMLQRNLLYTAVTRGKRLVVLVGSRKALGIAVRNADVALRCSGLAVRLAAG